MSFKKNGEMSIRSSEHLWTRLECDDKNISEVILEHSWTCLEHDYKKKKVNKAVIENPWICPECDNKKVNKKVYRIHETVQNVMAKMSKGAQSTHVMIKKSQ